tara:strand:- start:525 stop:980 length:456 start_codon:yes stop_codon:yes gene_type:complete
MKAKISISRRPKSKAKKLPSLASLKAKCDKAFSIFIRTRDIDRDGTAACVTCGNRKPWRELQCSHFVSRVHLSTRFLPLNAHQACGKCNVLLRGNMCEYASYMEKTYGHGVIDRLLAEKRKTVKFSRQDYLNMIERFSGEAVNRPEWWMVK